MSLDENTGIISGRCLIESNTNDYTIICRNSSSQIQTEIKLSVGLLTKFSYPQENILIGINYDFRLGADYDGDNCQFNCTPGIILIMKNN